MQLLDQLMQSSNYWIRFELGRMQLEGMVYFEEIYQRATTIFNSIFDKDDEILIVIVLVTWLTIKK